MIGIRETVKRMVDAWWAHATPEQRYTKKCAVIAKDVLRVLGISNSGNVMRQARELISERVHELQRVSSP